jgi:hypothetical protein
MNSPSIPPDLAKARNAADAALCGRAMSAANPFIAALNARGWKLAGDTYARAALVLADRARECWHRAATCLDEAVAASAVAARQIDAARADPACAATLAELDADREGQS